MSLSIGIQDHRIIYFATFYFVYILFNSLITFSIHLTFGQKILGFQVYQHGHRPSHFLSLIRFLLGCLLALFVIPYLTLMLGYSTLQEIITRSFLIIKIKKVASSELLKNKKDLNFLHIDPKKNIDLQDIQDKFINDFSNEKFNSKSGQFIEKYNKLFSIYDQSVYIIASLLTGKISHLVAYVQLIFVNLNFKIKSISIFFTKKYFLENILFCHKKLIRPKITQRFAAFVLDILVTTFFYKICGIHLFQKFLFHIPDRYISFAPYLLSYVFIGIISNLILGTTMGQFTVGMRSFPRGFLVNRSAALFRFSLSLFSIPLILPEIPILFGKASLKEILSRGLLVDKNDQSFQIINIDKNRKTFELSFIEKYRKSLKSESKIDNWWEKEEAHSYRNVLLIERIIANLIDLSFIFIVHYFLFANSYYLIYNFEFSKIIVTIIQEGIYSFSEHYFSSLSHYLNFFWNFFPSLTFVTYHFSSLLFFSKSPGQYIVGICRSNNKSKNYILGVLQLIFFIFTCPFLIFDLFPILGVPTLKELIFFNRYIRIEK
ncbi:hypothetical protein OAB57_03130 [Bacteriovoracaceae bacterium]|nr:hypothetical protein [Bacteriovoracaceae bacterium]